VVIAPARRSFSLDQLLAGVTRGNRHGEVETGEAAGREVW